MEGLLPGAPSSHSSRYDIGTEGIKVDLWNQVDALEAARIVARFSEATFGDLEDTEAASDDWCWDIAQRAAEFKNVLPTSMESVGLTFGISGISRACTHQLVRTRVGAGFGQQGHRSNSISGFNFRAPDSVTDLPGNLQCELEDHVADARRLYDKLLDAGLPYQDARTYVPEGTETNLVAQYNLLSVIGLCRRRLCNRMQWEINYVSRLIHDEVVKALPWVGRALRASCEKTGVCQTVDPMFSPSCMWYNKERGWVGICQDKQALIDQTGGENYNWDSGMNGAVTLFEDADLFRIGWEGRDPDIVVSMVDGHTILASRGANGMWRRNS